MEEQPVVSSLSEYSMVRDVHILSSTCLSEPYSYPTFVLYFLQHSSVSFVALQRSTVVGAVLSSTAGDRGRYQCCVSTADSEDGESDGFLCAGVCSR